MYLLTFFHTATGDMGELCVFKPKGYNIVNAALADRQVAMEMSSSILASWPPSPSLPPAVGVVTVSPWQEHMHAPAIWANFRHC